METKRQKIQRLKEQQRGLRAKQPNVFNLKREQEILRRGLLMGKPFVEDKKARVKRLRINQFVARDLHLKRVRDRKERQRAINIVARDSKEALY